MVEDPKSSFAEQAGTHTGYDPQFERLWCRFERAVWFFFVLVLIVVLLGLLGRGPLNNRLIRGGDGSSVRYERVVRFRTPTTIECELPVTNGFAELVLNKAALEKLGLRAVVPEPTRAMGSSKVGPFRFQAEPPDSKTVLVQLQLEPAAVGVVHSDLTIDNRTHVVFSQLAVP